MPESRGVLDSSSKSAPNPSGEGLRLSTTWARVRTAALDIGYTVIVDVEGVCIVGLQRDYEICGILREVLD